MLRFRRGFCIQCAPLHAQPHIARQCRHLTPADRQLQRRVQRSRRAVCISVAPHQSACGELVRPLHGVSHGLQQPRLQDEPHLPRPCRLAARGGRRDTCGPAVDDDRGAARRARDIDDERLQRPLRLQLGGVHCLAGRHLCGSARCGDGWLGHGPGLRSRLLGGTELVGGGLGRERLLSHPPRDG